MKKLAFLVLSSALVASCSAAHEAMPVSGGLAGQSSILQPFGSGDVSPDKVSKAAFIEKFTLPTPPNRGPGALTLGSDGNIWFTETLVNNIGRITPSGVLTEFAVASHPFRITPGTPGTLWFSETNSIGQITTAGAITVFPMPSGEQATGGLTLGPDGNIWFVDDDTKKIGQMTPTGTVTEFALPGSQPFPMAIVKGPDGNLWFTDNGNNAVGRITTSGAVTEFPAVTSGIQLFDIVAASDGNLYASSFLDRLERVTTSGVVTEFTVPVADAEYLIQGPDKNLWISYGGHAQIGEFDIKRDVALNPVDEPVGSSGAGLAMGSDGNVWFANFGGYIGVIAGSLTTVGVRLNGELSITDPNYGFELGYAKGSGTTTQTISLKAGTYVHFKNLDTTQHTASLLGNATANNAPWPGSFSGGMTASLKLTAIGTTGFSTGAIDPGKTSRVYATGLPGFYMIGCGFHYNPNEMRTVIVVH
jgi:virginiamycin B lyase